MIRYSLPSILISVPPYLLISTRSPFFTSNGMSFPSSSRLPVPRAITLPSWGFSLAVSGIMIPPFFTSCSSTGCTSTRSPNGFTLIVFCTPVWFVRWTGVSPVDQLTDGQARRLSNKLISSCRRPPSRNRRPRRRLLLRLNFFFHFSLLICVFYFLGSSRGRFY